MGISLISELEPKNSGSFALLDDKYIRGGLRVVETFDELSLIPTDRLKDGCLSMVTTPSRVLYAYDKELNSWSPFSSGGGGGGSDWLCVEDGETTKLVKDVDTWTQKITVINHIRTYADYFALPTEYVQNNEVAYCKADVMEGTTIYKKGLYSYDASKASWVEVNSTIEIDSALSDTSKRPVQNRVVTKALDEKVSKDDVDNVISKYSENPIQNKAVATALEDVKNSKTLTAEEYDALDDETKNDGSFYYISDTGEIYQNGIIYGGKQIFDVTQEEYDALTDEEKAINEYHCTDTGRIYINGILYGDKKPIELTFEEYKQLEADGLVEEDVDYIITSDLEKGILLASEDVGYKDKTVHEALVTLESDVTTLGTDVATKQENIYKKHIASRKGDASDTKSYCLIATLKLSNTTFINEPIIIEGVMGGATGSIQKMLFKASFDFRNGASEDKKVIYGHVNQSLFNYIDLLATFDESAEIAYIYVHHKTNYSMIDADISIPQRNASMYLTIPETFERTETIIGTEVHRMSTSTEVKVLVGTNELKSKASVPSNQYLKVAMPYNKIVTFILSMKTTTGYGNAVFLVANHGIGEDARCRVQQIQGEQFFKKYINGCDLYIQTGNADQPWSITAMSIQGEVPILSASETYSGTEITKTHVPYEIASIMTTTRSLTLKSGYAGYITETYDPTTKVVVYNVNVSGAFKGLLNSVADGFRVPKGSTSSSDVMHQTIGIYGSSSAMTGDAQFTRLLVRNYGNPHLEVDVNAENTVVNGTITYVTA